MGRPAGDLIGSALACEIAGARSHADRARRLYQTPGPWFAHGYPRKRGRSCCAYEAWSPDGECR
ncbi:MAG: hypothetical protein AB1758_08275 [Candidatus Eremiobacterota bacterium]